MKHFCQFYTCEYINFVSLSYKYLKIANQNIEIKFSIL